MAIALGPRTIRRERDSLRCRALADGARINADITLAGNAVRFAVVSDTKLRVMQPVRRSRASADARGYQREARGTAETSPLGLHPLHMVRMSAYAKLLKKKDVLDLGCALVKVADAYPLAFLTERDFYPLVVTYLEGRVPNLKTELRGEHGNIDFRIGGNNPSLLELAVAPRDFRDANDGALTFRGHQQATHLYAHSNRTELRKLAGAKGVKARYLLLINLRAPMDTDLLKRAYERELPNGDGHHPVTVVYVFKNGEHATFTVGGKGKGRRRMIDA